MKTKKIILSVVVLLFCVSKVLSQSAIDLNVGLGKISMDGTGRLISLSLKDKENVLDLSRNSFLMKIQKHGEGDEQLEPNAMKVIRKGENTTHLVLFYEGGITATIEAKDKKEYLRLELIDITPLPEIARITWGPINTVLKEPLGGYLGLIRNQDNTIVWNRIRTA